MHCFANRLIFGVISKIFDNLALTSTEEIPDCLTPPIYWPTALFLQTCQIWVALATTSQLSFIINGEKSMNHLLVGNGFCKNCSVRAKPVWVVLVIKFYLLQHHFSIGAMVVSPKGAAWHQIFAPFKNGHRKRLRQAIAGGCIGTTITRVNFLLIIGHWHIAFLLIAAPQHQSIEALV